MNEPSEPSPKTPPGSRPIDAASVREHWHLKASHWTGWADTMAAMADRFNQPLLDAIGLAAGDSLLDLASGAGEPALSAADRVAADGLVVASDFVPAMLQGLKAREEAETPRATRLRLVAADMQALPFRTGGFSHVSCRFGIMFVPDPAKAMRETARVLAPGGRAGFLVWGPRADQTLFTVLGDAVEEIAGMGRDDHHWQVFRFGAEGSLAALFEAAGFSEIEERALRFSPVAPADRPFWRPQLDMSFGHVLDGKPKTMREAIDARVRDMLEPLRTADGTGFQMQAHLRLVTGRAPA